MAKKKSEIQELSEFIRDNMVTRAEFHEEIAKLATKEELAKHEVILQQHTRQLNHLQGDMDIMRDKRMQLEVRVTKLERHGR